MKIGVIMGGVSSEREISLKSGEQVIKHLNKDKYEKIIPITINSKQEVIEKIKGIDFAFIALHGKFGEDGTIQGALETMGIPYSGCKVLPSAICMNKGLTKSLVKTVDVDTAKWIIVKSVEEIDYKKIKELQYPVFIKPNKGGSSVATFFIRNENEVEDRLYEIQYKGYTPVIAHVERYFKDSLDIERIQDFIDNGYLIQVNATSFLGYHGKHAQKFAYQLLNQGLLHVIATDTHRCDGHRSPCLQEVFDLLVKKYSYEDIHTLMYENPLHIINNEEVDLIEGKTSFFKKIFKRR